MGGGSRGKAVWAVEESDHAAFGRVRTSAGSLQFLVNAPGTALTRSARRMNGVIAATLARNDFVGRPNRWGKTACWSDTATTPIRQGGAGSGYHETMKIGVKPYPSCRYTHAASMR